MVFDQFFLLYIKKRSILCLAKHTQEGIRATYGLAMVRLHIPQYGLMYHLKSSREICIKFQKLSIICRLTKFRGIK